MRDDLDRALERIVAATGSRAARYTAPPYGVYNARRAAGSRGAGGWTTAAVDALGARLVERRATPASIAGQGRPAVCAAATCSLLHDADYLQRAGARGSRTAAALPRVLEGIEAAGLEFAEP